MSPRRRLLIGLLTAALAVALVIVGVRLVQARGPAVDPASRPAPDALGPVLLVPGYGGSRAGLLALAGRIEATGRPAQVLTLAGDGTGDLTAQVGVLDTAVDAALTAGAPSVDVIGYSAGGVMAGLWVARNADAAAKVRRVITLGAPLAGSRLAAVAATSTPDDCPVACRQLAPGSAQLAELAAGRVGSVLPWLSVWTTDDETVTPPDSARLAGAVNVSVQDTCPGARISHGELPTDAAVTGLVLRAITAAPLTPTGDCTSLRAAGSG